MILSFSVPAMLPYVRAGVRQCHGEDVGAERVKRQTIRARGPRAQKLLEFASTHYGTIPYELQLYWKARTPAREKIGVIEFRDRPRVYPIKIMQKERGDVYVIADELFAQYGYTVACWRPANPLIVMPPRPGPAPNTVEALALADGFDTVEAFCEFFTPAPGQIFDGVLFKW